MRTAVKPVTPEPEPMSGEDAREEGPGDAAEAIVARVREDARRLYDTRRLLCAEAVVVALNEGLGGGLSEARAIAIAAPFCIAMGESGCLCGALGGAVMATGLLIGEDRAESRRRELRKCARQLHDAFKKEHGATCCRVLTRKVRHDKKAHFDQCADLTEWAAGAAARLVLEKRPELASRMSGHVPPKRRMGFRGLLLRLLHAF